MVERELEKFRVGGSIPPVSTKFAGIIMNLPDNPSLDVVEDVKSPSDNGEYAALITEHALSTVT